MTQYNKLVSRECDAAHLKFVASQGIGTFLYDILYDIQRRRWNTADRMKIENPPRRLPLS